MKKSSIRSFAMKHGIAFSLSLCAAALYGADATYSYTAGATSLGDGAVTIVYNASSQITNLVATPAGNGKITITGDSMSFGNGAKVTIAQEGTLSFANSVVAAGSLELKRGDGKWLSWSGNQLKNSQVTAFPAAATGGTRLDQWEFVSSHLRNAHYNDSKTDIVGMAYPHVRNTSISTTGSIYYRFLSVNHWDGRRTYGVRVQMVQSTNRVNGLYGDIKLLANRWSQSHDGLNITNMDVYSCTPACGRDTARPCVANNVDAIPSYLLMDQATIKRVGAGVSKVRFDGGATFGGRLDVGLGMHAILAVPDSAGAVTLSNAIGGEGTFRVEPKVTGSSRWPGAGTVAYDGYLQKSWATVVQNRSLFALTNIVGYMHGTQHFSDKPYNCADNPPLTALRFENRGTEADCQFQFLREGDYIKTVVARFRQNGANIEGYIVKAGYKRMIRGYSVGDDMNIQKDWVGDTIATNISSGAYGMEHLTFAFADSNAVHLTLRTMTNYMTGAGAMEFAGVDGCSLVVGLNDNKCFPTGGVVRVKSGADVSMCTAGNSSNVFGYYSGGKYGLIVENGGAFRKTPLVGNGGIFSEALLQADGGTIDLSSFNGGSAMTYVSAGTYADLIELANGARLIGHPPSTIGARFMVGVWRVVGNKPCHFDCGVVPAVSPGNHNPLSAYYHEFYIEDVTKDSAVDATLAGVYSSTEANGSSYTNAPIRKTGSGTLRVDGIYTAAVLPTVVSNGTFMLGKSGITMWANDFTVSGGKLAADTGTANELGTLTVGAAGATIELGAGSSLSFADCSAVSWSGNLNITTEPYDPVAKVRFGTSDGALTSAQIDRIRMNGARVLLDGNGYLWRKGSLVIVY